MTSSLFPRCHRPPPGTGTGTGAGAGKGALGGREGRARRCPEGAERGPAAAGGGGVSAARPREVGTAAARQRVGGERWGVAGAPEAGAVGARGRGAAAGSAAALRCPPNSLGCVCPAGAGVEWRNAGGCGRGGQEGGGPPGFSLRAGILGLGGAAAAAAPAR